MFEGAFWKEHYGNVASVVALLLTVVGFIVTWWKQHKLREATEAAQRQALQVVHSFTERLASADLTNVVALARELRQTVGAKNWDRVADRAERLRTLLGHMIVSRSLADAERTFLRASVDDAHLILQAAEKALKQSDGQLSPQAMKTLDKLIMELNAIDGRLKNAQLEVPNG